MESANLNSSSPENNELETHYRALLSAAPLRDDGFSARVLAALPAAGERKFTIKRRLFCAAGLVAGVAVATTGAIGTGDLSTHLPSFGNALATAGTELLTAPVGLAFSLALFSLWFAFRDRMRLLPRW
jgi:hypothetical protein